MIEAFVEESKTMVDLTTLLAPISAEYPCGIDIRQDESTDSAYYKLKDARTMARADERNQVGKLEQEQEKSPHWHTILTLAHTILSTQTKDLEVACWYVEALLRIHGLAGLRDGFVLLGSLIENFWPDIYPTEDEEGLETKLAPLNGLFGLSNPGTLVQPINCLPITDPKNDPRYTSWQYQQALSLTRAPDTKTRNKKIENGTPTLEQLEAAAKKSPRHFYLELQTTLNQSIEAFNALFQVLEKDGLETLPNTSFVRSALQNIEAAIKTIAKSMLIEKESIDTETLEIAEDNNNLGFSPFTASSLSTNTIKQRSDALAALETIAEFFLKTEPHSPISYSLRRIANWATLPLPQLLEQLIQDKLSLEAYCKLTGVELPKPPEPPQMLGGPNPVGNLGYGGYNDPMSPPPLSSPGYNPAPYSPAPYGGGPMGGGGNPFNNAF